MKILSNILIYYIKIKIKLFYMLKDILWKENKKRIGFEKKMVNFLMLIGKEGI